MLAKSFRGGKFFFVFFFFETVYYFLWEEIMGIAASNHNSSNHNSIDNTGRFNGQVSCYILTAKIKQQAIEIPEPRNFSEKFFKQYMAQLLQ